MAMNDEIRIAISGHGAFRCEAFQMDRAISRHLPGSPHGLRQKIDSHENNTFPPGHYDGLITVTEYLMVLAWLDAQQDG